MADEFPTLEVALAACVLWLSWRGWHLVRSATRIDQEVEHLAEAVRAGQEPPSDIAPRGPLASWLGPLIRGAGSSDPSTIRPQLGERVRRLRRRLRSAAARDLVVSAVLIGALTYARAANLGVSSSFFVLGALASFLLFVSVAVRLGLDSKISRIAERLVDAVVLRASAESGAGPRCRVCGETQLRRVSGNELGTSLLDLGVEQVSVCSRCGHVSGQSRQGPARTA